jgi:hypothetical protein
VLTESFVRGRLTLDDVVGQDAGQQVRVGLQLLDGLRRQLREGVVGGCEDGVLAGVQRLDEVDVGGSVCRTEPRSGW